LRFPPESRCPELCSALHVVAVNVDLDESRSHEGAFNHTGATLLKYERTPQSDADLKRLSNDPGDAEVGSEGLRHRGRLAGATLKQTSSNNLVNR